MKNDIKNCLQEEKPIDLFESAQRPWRNLSVPGVPGGSDLLWFKCVCIITDVKAQCDTCRKFNFWLCLSGFCLLMGWLWCNRCLAHLEHLSSAVVFHWWVKAQGKNGNMLPPVKHSKSWYIRLQVHRSSPWSLRTCRPSYTSLWLPSESVFCSISNVLWMKWKCQGKSI